MKFIHDFVQKNVCGNALEPTTRDYVIFFISFIPIVLILGTGVIGLIYVITVILIPSSFWAFILWAIFIGMIIFVGYKMNE